MPKAQIKFLSDEWFILNFLRNWVADDLRLAISQDIDLSELLSSNKETPIAVMLIGIAERHGIGNNEQVNVGNILLWFAENRPDLYKVLVEKEESVAWLTKNLIKLKKIL